MLDPHEVILASNQGDYMLDPHEVIISAPRGD